jgi:UDP-N-acetylmuramate--alanine ligase
VVCIDHPIVQELLPRLRKKVVTYGLSRQADVRAEHIAREGLITRFTVWNGDAQLGQVELHMPGEHNVLNALAATATALGLDIPFEQVQAGLSGFSGVDRRFTVRHQVSVDGAEPVLIVDDYGHHPVEIEATLSGARAGFPDSRIIAVFQPHRYSRVRDLFNDFCRCFHEADHVVVCPIYRAGETPIEGVDHRTLAAGLRSHGHRRVHRVEDLDQVVSHLAAVVRPGDVVITLGAGNVNSICEPLSEALL